MTYSLSGEFYEACDCEVVCSCWAGVPPDMGICTGLYAWHITSGTVDGVDVCDCIAMLIFNGASCDLASNVMLLVQAGTRTQLAAVEAAVRNGPWADVVRLDAAVVMLPALPAVITISLGGNTVSLSASAPDIVAEAFCRFEGFKMEGGPAGNLIERSTGSEILRSINVGQIYTNAATGSGLNLLATTSAVPPYTFDLDLTDVSAVSGKFSYTLA